jgi:hypothetical protein
MHDLKLLEKKLHNFVKAFYVDEEYQQFDGSFALVSNNTVWDLYGTIDAVYSLWILNEIQNNTSRNSRIEWSQKILSCQDENGWFTKRNFRGHSKEHATAYAIGALRLLEIDNGESYVSKVKPLEGIKEIFKDKKTFEKWINRLGFKITLDDPVGHAGWHYIWRSSHLGGGIAAALGMTKEFHKDWWPEANTEEWFTWYFSWLDRKVNKKTGYWQRAFWNWIIPGGTLIDMAGAVHFYWVYEKYGQPLPYPEKIIKSTLKVQKVTGLYRHYPMCIDLDGNFCLIRAYSQLSPELQEEYFEVVNNSLEKNFTAVIEYLEEHPLEAVYNDSHGLPGALAALAECQEFEGFTLMEEAKKFKNPFEKVWWL